MHFEKSSDGCQKDDLHKGSNSIVTRDLVGPLVGLVGNTVDECDGLGVVGRGVGSGVSSSVGLRDGLRVGSGEGLKVGSDVVPDEGPEVGFDVGSEEGPVVGSSVPSGCAAMQSLMFHELLQHSA